MTFGALPAWAAWLVIAAAGALAARLFLLKLRPPHIIVPSLLFWRRVLDESRQLTLWERVRRMVSLVATIIVAVLLAVAFARPARLDGTATASRGRLLIVLDSSWSMLAKTTHGETRWDRAVAEARRLAVAASGEPVAIATTADGLVEGPTTDLALLESALDRIVPSGGALSAWPSVAGTQVVHFITDGTIARALDPAVVVDSVFEPASNVAITAFDVRPSLDDSHAADAYLEIGNFAAAQRVHVSLARGTVSLLETDLDLGAGEAARQAVPLPSGGDALLRAKITARENALPVDDEAVAIVPRARPLAVTVVSEQPAWLAGLLAKDRGVHASIATPAAYRPGTEDVVIFDRWVPKDAPVKPALCFEPSPSVSWLGGNGGEQGGAPPDTFAPERQLRWSVPGTHPVTLGVDPFTFTIDRVRAYHTASLTPVAVSERGTPLVDVSASPQRRFVVVAFGPNDSNLASAPGFPVLVTNALEWLARPEVRAPRAPGGAVLDATISRLTGPDGRPVPLQHVHDQTIAVLRAPGVYVAEGGGARSTFAVNVGDGEVSNLQRTGVSAARGREVTAGASSHAWWVYVSMAAFVLVFAEWWTWLRRITV